jgi:hypothetical protein
MVQQYTQDIEMSFENDNICPVIQKLGVIPIFGSQLLDKNTSTPYSDATKVCKI